MAQIVNNPSFGSSIGSGFGSALGEGLSSLAEYKLNQLMQRQQEDRSSKGLRALEEATRTGQVTPELFSQISQLDPQIVQNYAKQLLEAPGRESYAQALASITGTPVSGQQQSEPNYQELGPRNQQNLQQLKKEAVGPFSLINPELQKQRENIELNAQQQQPIRKAQLSEKQATDLAKLGLEKRKIDSAEKRAAFAATKAERKEIIMKARSARNNLHDLERMEELEKEGKLDTPGYIEFLKRSGLDIPALMDEGSQEFQKIANNFTRDAKTYFGGRVSNFEIEQFLKTIPSLSQTPEGRKRVIANLKNLNRMDLEYNNALKEIVSENEGVPPYDLLEKVDDKVEKKQEKLSKMFKEDLAKPAPKGQNRLVTAAQSIAGSVVGAPGKLLSGLANVGKSAPALF